HRVYFLICNLWLKSKLQITNHKLESPMVFKQVTIIGTGLIGGSLGLALKQRRLAGRIVGCDRAPVLERAGDRGAIDTGTTNAVDAVRGSDLVVLATPVLAILDHI